MSDATTRLDLPFIASGQAQKELFHNEALSRIDAALHAVAQAIGDDTPPSAPVAGQCWIIGTTPTGDWVGQADALAAWTDDGWRFIAPPPGMIVWLPASGIEARFDGSAWIAGDVVGTRLVLGGVQLVGLRQPAIPAPSGGTTIDVEGRAVIGSIIATLMTHGLIAI
jgi:hypothetical protein